MRTFHCEVTIEKMGITSSERDTIKSQIKECAYSYSDDIYDERYSKLLEVCNDKVKDYYNNKLAFGKTRFPAAADPIEHISEENFLLQIFAKMEIFFDLTSPNYFVTINFE